MSKPLCVGIVNGNFGTKQFRQPLRIAAADGPEADDRKTGHCPRSDRASLCPAGRSRVKRVVPNDS